MEQDFEEIEDVEKVADGLYYINTPEFPSSNSFLLSDEKTILIDTGPGKEILNKLVGHVDLVLNSHFHYDHVRGDGLFEKVRISKIESPALEGPENFLNMCGVSDSEIRENMRGDILEGILWPDKVEPFSINEVLDLGRTQWEVIHTPGHSPGHCSFYEEKRGILISGDCGPEKFGPWYGWPSSDLPYFIKSIEKIIEIDPEILLSGHRGPITSDVVSQMEDYLEVIWERDRKIKKLDEKGADLQEILSENIFYKDEIKSTPLFKFFAETMISKHLEAEI